MKTLILLCVASCFLLQTTSGAISKKTKCNLLFRCNPHVKRPVCGTNGVTYINGCFLAQAICRSNGKIQKARDGKCCRNRCTFRSCGRGRKCVWSYRTCRYSCPCQITCRNVRCAYYARCVHDSRRCTTKCVCSRFCPKIYRPVCGSDGKTYGNQCELNYATCRSKGKIVKKHDGRCKCLITCANARCGVGSRCVHDPKKCITKCVCSNICTKIYRPVCGSDGRTYGNQCQLNYVTCRTKGKIVKKHNGRCCRNRCSRKKCLWGARCVFNRKTCRHRCVCYRRCPYIRRPVCGSNKQTYINRCVLNVARCKSKGKISFLHNGRCKN